MLRRLYFLLPDEGHTEAIVDQLLRSDVPKGSMHALGNEQHSLEHLPKASLLQRNDRAARLESIIWFGNLWIFFSAFVLFIISMLYSYYLLTAAMSLLMLLTFVAGERFVTKLPNTHLDNFSSALKHGEVILMVDVPFYQIKKISDHVRRHHPEAQLGGVCWSINLLGA